MCCPEALTAAVQKVKWIHAYIFRTFVPINRLNSEREFHWNRNADNYPIRFFFSASAWSACIEYNQWWNIYVLLQQEIRKNINNIQCVQLVFRPFEVVAAHNAFHFSVLLFSPSFSLSLSHSPSLSLRLLKYVYLIINRNMRNNIKERSSGASRTSKRVYQQSPLLQQQQQNDFHIIAAPNMDRAHRN